MLGLVRNESSIIAIHDICLSQMLLLNEFSIISLIWLKGKEYH